ncbi:MAG: hypothetical protein VB859_19735 [Planctomycetaceae bacterium]|jgi:hypothetical protein
MTSSKLLVAAGLIMLVSGLGIGGCVLTTYNTLVDDEEGIRAQEKQIDIAMDKMIKKIEGQGYVVANFKSTLIEVLATTIGQGGRAASGGKFFQAVSERYPDVPSGVWSDMAATMNAEYESMAASQSTKVAKIESLRKHLRRPHYLLSKGLGGFPTIDLEEHDKLILGSKARKGRETGVIETIDPFEKKSGDNTQ